MSPSDSPDPTFVLSRSGSGILSAFWAFASYCACPMWRSCGVLNDAR